MSETVFDFFAKDHDRLDSLFTQFQNTKQSNFEEARDSFSSFRFGLKRHIIWEEEILFPIFENKTGMVGQGPTAVMRAEHRDVLKALESIFEGLGEGSLETGQEENMLLSLLSQHNMKEESVLYPAIDQSISDEERRKIFQKIDQLPYSEEEIRQFSL